MAEQVEATACFERIRNRPRNVALLVGAGCSFTGGIPLASGFVSEIRKRYPNICSKLSPADAERYNSVVARLTDDEWLELYRKLVEKARINLAHLCIAELVSQGVVDRVLTTNFDSLLTRACAMTGEFPAVYDCAVIADLSRVLGDRIPAIYYLHGQAYGCRMLNSEEELKTHSKYICSLVQQTVERRTLVVCGYSGDCDGVLDWLLDAPALRNPVFWVPFNKQDADNVATKYESKKHLYVIENYDADEFFYDLLVELERKPPVIVSNVKLFSKQARQRICLPAWFPRSRSDRHQQPEETRLEAINSFVSRPDKSGGWLQGS